MERFLSEHQTYPDGSVPKHWYVRDMFSRSCDLHCNLQSCHWFLPLLMFYICLVDMSSTAFIEPLPVIDFVTQLLNRDVLSRPLSDADRVKVSYYFNFFPLIVTLDC